MRYQQGYIGPIRNANGPTGNGAGSVDGPCGGTNSFGQNGVGAVVDGDTVTLEINYAAGHTGAQQAFRMALSCGDTTENAVEALSAALTAQEHGCTGSAGTQTTTYIDNEDGVFGIPAPNGPGGGPYEVTCTLPLQGVQPGEEKDCVISLLENRQWGGCVDVKMSSAAVAQPPSPPPAPLVSAQGSYLLTEAGLIDSSAASFTCCPLVGELTIDEDGLGAAAVSGRLEASASGCRTSADTTAPPTATKTFSQDVSLALAFGSKYEGTVSLDGQPFLFSVEGGVVTWAYEAPDATTQPICCDGVSEPLGLTAGDAGGCGTGCVVGIVFALIAVLGVAFLVYWVCYRKQGPAKGSATGTPNYQMNAPPPPPMNPPPPPPPGPQLPPGWTKQKDPASGVDYYVNNATGQSQWQAPEFV